MSANLPSLYAQQFATNVALLVQQKGSRLRNAVMNGQHYGKQASPVDQIGVIEMNPVTARFAPITRTDAPVDRRWVLPTSYDLAQQVDSFDELRLLSDPKSVYVENMAAAAGRQIDRLLITAFFGTSLTGETAGTSTTFNSSYAIAQDFKATGAVGLTVAKLREARRLLMANNVDLDNESLFCAVTAKQHDDLLGEAQVTSLDFNDRPVLVDGRITRFLGINFIHTELLTLSTYRLIPVWVKSGMHLGTFGEIQTKVSQRDDLSSQPWQAYCKMTFGATRIEEKKVIKISCSES